jgi:hypothetical protein
MSAVGIWLTPGNHEHSTCSENETRFVHSEVDGAFDHIENLSSEHSANGTRMVQTVTRTYVLSFVPLLGLRPLGGIMSCPAAIKSPSPKTFWKNQSWFAAGRGVTIFAVNAIPEKSIILCRRIFDEIIQDLRLCTSSLVTKSTTMPCSRVLSSQPSSGLYMTKFSAVWLLLLGAVVPRLRPAFPSGIMMSLGIRRISLMCGTNVIPDSRLP